MHHTSSLTKAVWYSDQDNNDTAWNLFPYIWMQIKIVNLPMFIWLWGVIETTNSDD